MRLSRFGSHKTFEVPEVFLTQYKHERGCRNKLIFFCLSPLICCFSFVAGDQKILEQLVRQNSYPALEGVVIHGIGPYKDLSVLADFVTF